MGCGIKHECIGNCCICIHTPNGNSEWLKQVKHDEQVRANAIDEFLTAIDKAIIARKEHTTRKGSSLTTHVNDFDEVKRETLYEIAEQLKEQNNQE